MDLNEINRYKMKMFAENVNKQADEEIALITAKIRDQKTAAGREKEEAAAREAISEIRREQTAFEQRYKRELSRCDYETSKAVRAYRKELVDGFFEEIKQELKAFAESEKYDAYLKRSLEKAKDALGEKCVILCAIRDVEKLKTLCKNEVRADNAIMLGGIGALDEEKGLFCDFTLDKALDDEKSAFSDKKELRL